MVCLVFDALHLVCCIKTPVSTMIYTQQNVSVILEQGGTSVGEQSHNKVKNLMH